MSIGAALTISCTRHALTIAATKGGVDLENEVSVVSGETDTIDFTFQRDGVEIDLTSATAIVMRRKSYPYGQLDSTDLTGLLDIVAPATDGTVRLSPDSSFWAKGVEQYLIEFAVTVGGVVYVLPDPDNGHFRAVVRQSLS